MGQVYTRVFNRVQRLNVENRAERVISKEKPTPAPQYPRAVEELERILKDHPEIQEEQLKKNADLDSRLKQVYVVAHKSQVDSKPQSVSRPLPQNRHPNETPEFGYFEPDIIPKGNVTLRQAVKFIQDHQGDPKFWTSQKIAKHYSLTKESTDNILKYFHTFELYIPPSVEGGKKTLRAIPATGKLIDTPKSDKPT